MDKMKKWLAGLGITVKNTDLYKQALTHNSVGGAKNYLTFACVGDSFLNHIVVKHLYYKLGKSVTSDQISVAKNQIISRSNLGQIAIELGFDYYIYKDDGVIKFNVKLYGEFFEALIWAIHEDLGAAVCEKFIENHVPVDKCTRNPINQINEMMQKSLIKITTSKCVPTGDDFLFTLKIKRFEDELTVQTTGKARSKKQAKMAAYTKAIESLS